DRPIGRMCRLSDWFWVVDNDLELCRPARRLCREIALDRSDAPLIQIVARFRVSVRHHWVVRNIARGR
ncbi:hypothetical protein NL529_29905, partial [Klebsiella pneumoniae]|nr:hypothetical protein [Klebsiella pneumoniae]